jgi:hypothetical protein
MQEKWVQEPRQGQGVPLGLLQVHPQGVLQGRPQEALPVPQEALLLERLLEQSLEQQRVSRAVRHPEQLQEALPARSEQSLAGCSAHS